ncbi:hypothetical protein BVRB_8g199740 [Beta vulgaris subsp. vulgaris]|uniref:Uncharacterized protein n=1 Tax=Beta vulgaris subsp. vulgaris TaxID=3555 RepID=A0A0J8B712_BETVV|nr:hypothetical protein BVRB_8g199740 [Beta vulgaris subsp. vulgaris]
MANIKSNYQKSIYLFEKTGSNLGKGGQAKTADKLC